MRTPKEKKRWTKTNTQNLVRYKTGVYYARIFSDGKERWKSLGTKVYDVAKQKLNELRGDAPKIVKLKSGKTGRMTMGDAMDAFEQEIQSGRRMRNRTKAEKPNAESTKHYRRQTLEALKRSWESTIGEDLAAMEVRKVAGEKVRRWAESFQKNSSATRYNNTMGTLRRLFEIAIEAGELYGNPAQELQRIAPKPKEVELPSPVRFIEFANAIRAGGSTYAGDRADFVEFLAYTGCRKSEAANVIWGDVDFTGGWITLRVTKGGRPRVIPMITDARRLLERMRSERPDEGPEELVLRVNHARECMNAAAEKLEMPRLTHHDLRSLFATLAIESGAPIPTVAEILGHKDGGKLLLDTYNRTRHDHKKEALAKLSFRA